MPDPIDPRKLRDAVLVRLASVWFDAATVALVCATITFGAASLALGGSSRWGVAALAGLAAWFGVRIVHRLLVPRAPRLKMTFRAGLAASLVVMAIIVPAITVLSAAFGGWLAASRGLPIGGGAGEGALRGGLLALGGCVLFVVQTLLRLRVRGGPATWLVVPHALVRWTLATVATGAAALCLAAIAAVEARPMPVAAAASGLLFALYAWSRLRATVAAGLVPQRVVR